jgi:hypothetical protein
MGIDGHSRGRQGDSRRRCLDASSCRASSSQASALVLCVCRYVFQRWGRTLRVVHPPEPPSLGTLGILRSRTWPNSDIHTKHTAAPARVRIVYSAMPRCHDVTPTSHGAAPSFMSTSPRAILHSLTRLLRSSTSLHQASTPSHPVIPDNHLAPHGPLPTQFDAPQPHLTILHLHYVHRTPSAGQIALGDVQNPASAPRPP